jgi:asparagine synthase (glutamine-hydrolysing)
MCGICGIFGKKDEETIKKMLVSLSHRGPDDTFYVTGENFCLGATRLSIIDLEHGRQPIKNEDGNIFVAQNGEIYNFPELREQLLAKNHRLKTRCDTEVLVHLYEDFNKNFPKLINGMFAISIWDGTKKKGILLRDRVGKKPLYYLLQNGSLYFASEIKALLQIPGFKKEINLEALHYYLSYKHIPCPLSIFKNIYQLPPASILTFHLGREPKIEKYWKLSYSPILNISEEEIVFEITEKLKEAVKRRLISDVPIGFFLSGGVDSGLLTAIAAEVSDSPIKTFTLTYSKESLTEGKKLDREYAQKISKMYGTEHHEEIIGFINFSERLPKIISHFDEPFSGVVSTYFLSELISKHVKVAVSGDGSDEEFGSYLSHRLSFPIDNLLHSKEVNLSQYNLGIIERLDELKDFAEKEDWRWRYKLLVFTDEEKKLLYSPDLKETIKNYNTLKHLKGYFSNLTAKDALNRILESEFRSFFPDQVLTYVDRLSMAHSLEIRAPYLDYEFVELVAKIPGKLKIREGETKYILKKVALKYLPQEIVYRKKEGFVTPTFPLIKNLESYVKDRLSIQSLKKHNLFNVNYVQKLLDNFYNKNYPPKIGDNLSYKILNLLSFQVWYELYM